MDSTPLLMLGLPKGSLQDSTIKLFGKAGFNISVSSRSYRPSIDDPELDGRFVRAQEVSRYVEHGYFDCGLTGQDWVRENDSDVVEVCSLVYSRASNKRSKWIIAVPENSPVQSVKDLEGKRIATEVVNITRQYLKDNGVNAEVEFSWGATEVKVPDLVDAIVDLTETGNSIRANKLRIVDTLLYTNTVLIANKAAWENPEKRKKIENIAMLLQAALEANSKVGLKLNIEKSKLDDVLANIPALRNPTINRLTDENWVAIDTILDEKIVRELIPELKARGAEGIIEYPLNKVVY
ncbi:MAG: ATP phosphoribosyltransferase [Opitutales bacterium]|jgi:ATP phosphoribosyltransferase|nr:ATP phosphoribosyltransferase [Opitutales bacterium]MDP4693642.1 ATP phosphoribosyltransferase [Opitutales bacterium]MDP4776697.1 ATP phosphoribosyltransferase [Opitutales bacterium]MDP4884637.1 ATP phosphoribosyltransferase [Opitutales bacterium]MDP5080560.1 ATP phosphoribosyltransferase [Opitutales bacterium]